MSFGQNSAGAAIEQFTAQLQVALQEQGTKAALAWRHQQEVARLQETLGKRSVELLAKDQQVNKMRAQLMEVGGVGWCTA